LHVWKILAILGYTLYNKNVQMCKKGKKMKVFISHSVNEAHIANDICNVLEKAGKNCFIAPRDIRSGFPYAEEIANGIDSSDLILLVLSEAANESPHVLREIERAVSKRKKILVYRLSDVQLATALEFFLKTNQWMDAEDDNYRDLVSAVDALDELMEEASPVSESVGKVKKKQKNIVPIVVVVILIVLLFFVGYVSGLGDGSDTKSPHIMGGKDLKPGDTFVMGSYNNEDIYWRVLKISEDETEAVVVAKDVITVKAFDAPESGQYNHDGVENYNFAPEKIEGNVELQAYVQGNSAWETSSIRTWLNATTENVVYEGYPPVSAAMADDVNGYSNEKGFLCSFTDEELTLIKETTVETKGNALADSETIVTQDKIFLLSLEELVWFEEADVSMVAVPTAAAIANDKSTWYNDYCIGYGVDETMWWLRDPVAESASQCYLVGNGYHEENIYTWEAGVESFGIRPAMTIDLTVK